MNARAESIIASPNKFGAQAEAIGDGMLEACIAIVFEPTVPHCEALIRQCEGATTFARLLRASLLAKEAA